MRHWFTGNRRLSGRPHHSAGRRLVVDICHCLDRLWAAARPAAGAKRRVRSAFNQADRLCQPAQRPRPCGYERRQHAGGFFMTNDPSTENTSSALRILIVDDDEAITKTFGWMLEA